jgi:hypothetical protein
VALIAYLQRLGTDIAKPEPVAIEEEFGPGEQPAGEDAEGINAVDATASEEAS